MSDKEKTRVLFYKSKWGDKKWIDNLISLWTWSKYSHVEIWTPNEDGVFEVICMDVPPYWRGTCWTSTMRGEDKGTVKRPASSILDHPDRWDYIELEITIEQYNSLVTWMKYQVKHNKGYSKWDLLKFVFPVHFPDALRNICSEFANNGLVGIGVLVKFGIVSPGKMHKKLTKLRCETKSLTNNT